MPNPRVAGGFPGVTALTGGRGGEHRGLAFTTNDAVTRGLETDAPVRGLVGGRFDHLASALPSLGRGFVLPGSVMTPTFGGCRLQSRAG